MADSIVQGLFGIDPLAYQQAQQNQLDTRAQEFAQMTPMQRAQYGIYKGASQIGTGAGQLMGVQDPILQKATLIRQLAGQFDTTTPEGLRRFGHAAAQQGHPDIAQQAITAATDMESKGLLNEKAKYSLDQEKALRDALTQLGPDATDEQYMAVYRQFGGANALGTAMERSIMAKEKIAAKTAEAEKVNAQVRDEMLGSAIEGKTLVENIRKKVDYTTVGALGGVLSHVPMTGAAEFSSDVKELQSKLTMAVMAAAKAQSKTGATGFGALNMKELEVIKQNIADLDQSKLSPEKFNEKLNTINAYFNKLEQKANGTYNPRDTGGNDGATGGATGADPLNLRKK